MNHGSSNASNLTLVVRGVSGDAEYMGMTQALGHHDTFVNFFEWGAPRPLFVLNFNSKDIHDAAEKQLADKLTAWRKRHPHGEINLVGHSAGCGVILGGLPRAGELHVHNVVLLAPSVSPGYDCQPALNHIDGKLNAFYSDRDFVFLKLRTGNFGTYDNIRTPASGNKGFTGPYPADHFAQSPFNPAWEKLGNDGGHFGPIAHDFVEKIVAPLVYASR